MSGVGLTNMQQRESKSLQAKVRLTPPRSRRGISGGTVKQLYSVILAKTGGGGRCSMVLHPDAVPQVRRQACGFGRND